jgi:hypothetical protein
MSSRHPGAKVGSVLTPSPALPLLGRENSTSTQRGEAGRGVLLLMDSVSAETIFCEDIKFFELAKGRCTPVDCQAQKFDARSGGAAKAEA